jgi:hypothetical protein
MADDPRAALKNQGHIIAGLIALSSLSARCCVLQLQGPSPMTSLTRPKVAEIVARGGHPDALRGIEKPLVLLSVIRVALGSEHSAAVTTLARAVASGNLMAGDGAGLASRAFGAGYQTLLLSAAIFAGISAIISWLCVRADETRPVAKGANANQMPVMPLD